MFKGTLPDASVDSLVSNRISWV